MDRPFSKTELKHLKYSLMKRGYTSDEANLEIKLLIETVNNNHKIEKLNKKIVKLKEKKGKILPIGEKI